MVLPLLSIGRCGLQGTLVLITLLVHVHYYCGQLAGVGDHHRHSGTGDPTGTHPRPPQPILLPIGLGIISGITIVVSWQVWVTIIGTLVLMTLLVHVLDRLSPFSYRNRRHVYAEGGKVYTVKESAWFVMGSFTKSGRWLLLCTSNL